MIFLKSPPSLPLGNFYLFLYPKIPFGNVTCRVDLIDSVDQLLTAFGFTIRLNGKHHWFSTLITTLAWLDACLSLVGFIPVENADLLTLFADPGYIAFGPKHRQILNITYFFFKWHLLVMQVWFMYDKHQWLRDANTEFHQLKSIYIVDIQSMVRRCKMISVYMACMVAIGATSSAIINVMLLQHKGINVRFYTFIFYVPCTVLFQTYFSGLYFCQFYFLIKLSIMLMQQYNRHHLEILSTQPNQQNVSIELQQFTHLYMVIQHLKTYMTRSYITICVACFGASTQLYYTAFYTDIHIFVRCFSFIICVAFFVFIVYFSTVSDRINSEARFLSTVLYERFYLTPNRLDSIAFELEVVLEHKIKKKTKNTRPKTKLKNPKNLKNQKKILKLIYLTVVQLYVVRRWHHHRTGNIGKSNQHSHFNNRKYRKLRMLINHFISSHASVNILTHAHLYYSSIIYLYYYLIN